MKRFIIGSGWKMNNTIAESITLLDNLEKNLDQFDYFPLFVLPSFTALHAVSERLAGNTRIIFGAQNMHWEEYGAFTGEISAPMLRELGCTYVELNHQERRAYFNENNEITNLKILTALKFGLKPILCLGEETILSEREVHIFLQEQMAEMLKDVSHGDVTKIIFAYEPRWAIGKALAAPATHIKMVHGIIREVLSENYGAIAAQETYVIYGGSVDKSNAIEIATQDGVDGLFIGRSGLQVEIFSEIIKSVACEFGYK
ncbi:MULTISPECIES: triose-phosphate isomerase [Pelosinus]|uniref:Triosephosphate isomerase n=1 Tax=Pelosinus fermentans B4 TaxID=1149862 RepID=I9B2S6_9FIRM|nr:MULTISPECIES: triose-phosphate isomerase [Pelosinus]EIW19427.1 triosephosphate isomerase [Pelosinus fermentans B4]EIW24841.1 triosephosphate isomerase [Pelosinus fermentans A11]OAM96111.1 Triosephosphate isomerase, bacterial/eukaryotic [Pelosinus fermentans DSM 17108]SDR36470.1 triosephosphate isomerase [Pelosinus fermentans]